MSLKNGAKMSQREKFDLINSEVRSFYEYCKEAGMSDEEMDLICRPLTAAVRKSSVRRWTRVSLFLVMMFAIGFTVSQTDTFQWHASAVARIVLIKLLPVWDWTPLYYNKCIIDKPQTPVAEVGRVSSESCIACEAVRNIDRLSDTSYKEVFTHHLLRGAPVIVVDANYDWSSQSDLNLTKIIGDDQRLQSSVPCRALTNLRLGRQPMDLEEIVSRITSTDIPSWFLHFQNCDMRAVKAFRVLAPRPYFLSPHIPPSHFNWLLMSKNYETHRYKSLELDAGLVIMSQVQGKTFVQLKPRSPCEDQCYTLNFQLSQGETLVLGNAVWELEYLPSAEENMALVTETDWLES